MRPLKLRMAGLRSYRAERTVDFTDLSLVAIIGPTGSGKSSLLEGITYALYGASTWDKRGVKELISDAASSMRVSLEFEADGEEWRVTRLISQKAAGSHELICLSDPDVPKVDGDRAVNARIEELVGLDYDGFCSCVLLPQGKFEQLLKATRKDRASILKGIMRLDELDLIRERASELGRRLTPRCEEILEARSQFLPDPVYTRDEAASRQRQLQPKLEALTHAKETVDTLIEEVRAHQQSASAAEAGAGRVDELFDKELIYRLGVLGDLEDELASEQRVATKSAKQAKIDAEAAERVVADLRKNSSDSVSINNAGDTLVSAREDLSAITAEEKELATDRNQLAGEVEMQSAETVRLARLAVTVAERQSTAHDREQTVKAADDAHQALDAQIREIVAAREALRIAQLAVEMTGDRHTSALTEQEAANANLDRVRNVAIEARAAQTVGQHAALAAQVARDCHAGDPCPICARTLPESFITPALPEGVQALHSALARAEHDERVAVRDAGVAEGAAAIAERAADEARRLFSDNTTIWESHMAATLPDGLDVNTIELDGTTIEHLRAPQRAAKAGLEIAHQELEAAQKQHTRLQATCEAAAREHERRVEALTAVAEGLERRRATVSARLKLLPAWIDLGANPDDAAFDGAAQLVAVRLAEAAGHEQGAASANQARVTAEEATRSIEARMSQDVRGPARSDRAILTNLRAELARLQLELPPPPDETGPIAELVEWASVVLDAGAQELQRLRELTKSEAKAVKTKKNQGREIVKKAGFKESHELQQALIEVTAEEIAARREHEQAADQLKPTGQLDLMLVKARGLRDGLNELTRQLADAKFVGFVVERRQRSLLTSASGILSHMTAGQFGFTEDFQIIDRRSDMARSPDTLSGGETFLASLALALGLVELAGRSGGRLQALFLDEGFGSLDPDALDQALNELEQRAHAGRLIALISHVPAVAERIDQILRVTKTPQGSDIQLLNDAERQALLLDDAAEIAVSVQ